MSRHVMMMGKCTRWETSGRKNIWVLFVPARAMEDNRWVKLCLCAFVFLCATRTPELHDGDLVTRLCLCVFINFSLSFFRAGVVRTAEDPEDRLMWRLTSYSLLAQMCSTGTEKMLYANWSVSDYNCSLTMICSFHFIPFVITYKE